MKWSNKWKKGSCSCLFGIHRMNTKPLWLWEKCFCCEQFVSWLLQVFHIHFLFPYFLTGSVDRAQGSWKHQNLRGCTLQLHFVKIGFRESELFCEEKTHIHNIFSEPIIVKERAAKHNNVVIYASLLMSIK